MSFLSRVLKSGTSKLIKNTSFLKNQQRVLTNSIPALNKKEVDITFVRHDGKRIKVKGEVGDTFLNVVVKNNIELEGYGACEGTLTCSTCHLIFKQQDYDQLPDEPEGEEVDMLELARGLTNTSRLGCQVYINENMDGIEVKVPEVAADIRLESST